MPRAFTQFLIIVFMLTSFVGQALAMSISAQVMAHEIEHGGSSASVPAHQATGDADVHPSADLHANEHTDPHANAVPHDGKFGDTGHHHFFHVVQPLPLVTTTDFPIFKLPQQELAQATIVVLPRLTSPPTPLFRPPRSYFAS